MTVIIDKIVLKDASYRDDFIDWVKNVDYVACNDLPSVNRFMVHEVSSDDCDFLEIVHVSSMSEFERDMQTPVFQSLVERFSQMADVSGQSVCEAIEPGYQADAQA